MTSRISRTVPATIQREMAAYGLDFRNKQQRDMFLFNQLTMRMVMANLPPDTAGEERPISSGGK
jgi:hypothetical protein